MDNADADACRGSFAFLRRHLKGDFSLARSYWVNLILVQVVLIAAGTALLPAITASQSARLSSICFVVFFLVVLASWIWGIAGTWMSCGKHVARGGARFWAGLVRLVIILGVLRMAQDMAALGGAWIEHVQVAAGKQFGPAISIQVRGDGRSLLLKGGINDGTAQALERALKAAPTVTTVVLHSTGGWVQQGNQIARVIRTRRLNTYVEQECSSACTLAFLAGVERSGEPNARLGFHAFRKIGRHAAPEREDDATSASATYARLGLSDAFIARIVATGHNDMWYPAQEELLAEGVFTRLSLGGENAVLATAQYTRAQLAAELEKSPALRAMALKYPREYAALIEQVWRKMRGKRSDGEIRATARDAIRQLIDRLLPQAEDATLMAYHDLTLAQAQALEQRQPEACLEMMFPTGKSLNVAAFLPAELARRESELIERTILTSAPEHARSFKQAETMRILRQILQQLPPEQLALMDSQTLRERSPRAACQAAVRYLQAFNAIPAARRARSIRAVYSSK